MGNRTAAKESSRASIVDAVIAIRLPKGPGLTFPSCKLLPWDMFTPIGLSCSNGVEIDAGRSIVLPSVSESGAE